MPGVFRACIEEDDMGKRNIGVQEDHMTTKATKPALREVKLFCDCGSPIEGDHDLCGHCNVLRQARARGQALYMCMASCGAETPFNFCWHCNKYLAATDKGKAKKSWSTAHPDDPRVYTYRQPSSNPPPASAPVPEITDEPCEHEGCEEYRLSDSPFCYEHTLEQEELMADMFGIEITTKRPRKICAHEGCSVEIDPRHDFCRPHHQLHLQEEREARRATRPTKPCNKCGTPLPLTFVPDTCKTCYEAGKSQSLDRRRYPIRPEVPASQFHQELMRRSLLDEYCNDKLRAGATENTKGGQLTIVYDGKSYTFADKGHTAARNQVRQQREERRNRCLLAALKKGSLNTAWTVKSLGPQRWRLSYKGREYLITDHVAMAVAQRAEEEKARIEAERQAAELESKRQRHAELLVTYRAGELPDSVIDVEQRGVKVAFLLADETVLEFEDPELVAQAEAERREADRIKREAAAKAAAEAKAAKQATKDAKAERGSKKGGKRNK